MDDVDDVDKCRPRVLGLIAAAGASTRMGSPKALLPHDFHDAVVEDDGIADCFVSHLVRALAGGGADTVVVTVPDDAGSAAAIVDVVRRASIDAVCLANPAPALGLTGSVIAALDHDDDADVLVLCPVDAPFATPAIVAALIAAVWAGADAAVITVDGVRGHPVAFGRGAFGALRLAGSRGGPRQVLDELDQVVAVPSTDRRLTLDLNSAADLARSRQLSG